MKLLVTFTAHAVEVEGKYYNCSRALVDYKHLCRYRQYIKDVVVVLRCKKTGTAEPSWPRIDGDGISVAPIPDPASPLKAFIMLPNIIRAINRAISLCDRYLLKAPEPTATITGLMLLIRGKKYAVEVVANSREGILFAKKSMPFVGFYALLFDTLTKFLVRRAHCATYVSQYLRKHYPTKSRDREWVFSSVEFDKESVGNPHSLESFNREPFKIISVGRMSAEKGHLYLVHAFKSISEHSDKRVELHLVGDGPERGDLEKEAGLLGLSDKIHFHGYIKKGPELFSLMDDAHLFVIPSLTEGMGRGLLEAMARGLPCIGSSVGGIPEYLPEEALFEPRNPESITTKVLELLNNPKKLAQMSTHNSAAAKAHWPEALNAVKNEFRHEIVENCK